MEQFPILNWGDRKSTRLNSSHVEISYAVFCLIRRAPCSPLFPYTTLFRSHTDDGEMLWQNIFLREVQQGRKQFAFGEISGGTEDDHCASSSGTGSLSMIGVHGTVSYLELGRSEEHTSELQSRRDLVCRLLLDPASPVLSTLSLHDALPISHR